VVGLEAGEAPGPGGGLEPAGAAAAAAATVGELSCLIHLLRRTYWFTSGRGSGWRGGRGGGRSRRGALDVFGEGISVNQALASLHPYYYSRSFLLLLLLLVVMLVVVVVGGGKSGEGGGVVLDQPRKGHVRRSVETSRKLCLLLEISLCIIDTRHSGHPEIRMGQMREL